MYIQPTRMEEVYEDAQHKANVALDKKYVLEQNNFNEIVANRIARQKRVRAQWARNHDNTATLRRLEMSGRGHDDNGRL